MVGLGAFVLAGKEKLCMIRPKGDALALETLFLAEDVKSQEEIDEPVAQTEVKQGGARAREADHRGPRGDVRAGGAAQRVPRAPARSCSRPSSTATTSQAPAAEEESAPVIDLMEALRASVAASQTDAPAAKPAARRKRTAAGS